jgi:hypothetical protein
MEPIPLMEFDENDENKKALVRPERSKRLPESCILVMCNSVVSKLRIDGILKIVDVYKTPFVPIEVYQILYLGKSLTIVNPGIGAPLVVGTFELLIA